MVLGPLAGKYESVVNGMSKNLNAVSTHVNADKKTILLVVICTNCECDFYKIY